MAYLIDGHNLIPKIPGLSLQAPDDEMQLINLLQEFCRERRKRVEVYFDNAPPGYAQVRTFGLVVAHFVRAGRTADEAIAFRLRKLGKTAPNWTVVSSDRAIQSAARYTGARIMSSSQFADLLFQTLNLSGGETDKKPQTVLDANDLTYWLDAFGSSGDEG